MLELSWGLLEASFHRFPKQMPLSRWDLRGDAGGPFSEGFSRVCPLLPFFWRQMPSSRWDLGGDPGGPFSEGFHGYLRSRLDAILEHFGGILGHLGAILGLSWELLEASWSMLEQSWGRLGAILAAS